MASFAEHCVECTTMAILDNLRFTLWAIHLHQITRMPPERVLALQQRRLRRLLRDAVKHSAFFREKYRGIDVEQCPLAEIPTTTKHELMAHFDDAVTNPQVRRTVLERFIDDPDNSGRLFLDRYAVSHTSGSQGQPLLIVQDRLGLDLLFGFQMTRGNSDYGVGPIQAVHRFFSPVRLAVIASKRGFVPSASAWQHAPPALQRYANILFFSASDPDLVNKLNQFQPSVLTGYPSALESLALKADALRVPGLRQVTSNSETLTEQARARLTAAFGARVVDNYATGECIFLSTGCHTDRGAHINADWAILEVVDEKGAPVPPGQPGAKVLITNLANAVQPFIRYEVGDRAVLASEPCRCGNRLPRLARIEGRAADIFWLHLPCGVRPLPNIAFKNALDNIHELREWQAVQQGPSDILVRLEPLPGRELTHDQLQRVFAGMLDSTGLQGLLHIEWQIVSRLAPDSATGKFRRFVGMTSKEQVQQPAVMHA